MTLVTMMFHAFGLVLIAVGLTRLRLGTRKASTRRVIVVATFVIGAIATLLAGLHGFEAGFWAALYLHVGAFPSLRDAMLYSVDSLTTRGESGLDLPQAWKLLGAIESVDGTLLFGASAAFLFAIMQRAWGILAEVRD